MFHIKICGVREPEDVEAVANAGADAIGMNFFPRSIRYVDPDRGSTPRLSETASAHGLVRVGVFVNMPLDAIEEVVRRVAIDVVQLHGDESPDFASRLMAATWFRDAEMGLIRAIKLPVGPLDPVAIDAAVRPWINQNCHPLLDAEAGSAHGGSGQSLDWDAIGRWADCHQPVSFTLAGGLTPENVATAIEQSHAVSVDTASGVEEPRGRKSAALIEAFVRACRSASPWQQR